MSRDSRDHKDLQVCRQVHDALSYALAEIDDPLIDDLVLASVVPAPSASRVEITFVPSRPEYDFAAGLERLRRFEPELRQEVASEIHRKRVPVLVFRIVHPVQLAD